MVAFYTSHQTRLLSPEMSARVVGIAVAIIIGVGVSAAVSSPPPAKLAQVKANETAKGKHLEVNLEEKIGVKANP